MRDWSRSSCLKSNEIVRQRRDVLIVAHRLGFIMANAGVDQSNVAGEGDDRALLLPNDPDASAAALKARLDHEFGVDFGVIINDSFGRPWRFESSALPWVQPDFQLSAT